jgi:hypothetical protein
MFGGGGVGVEVGTLLLQELQPALDHSVEFSNAQQKLRADAEDSIKSLSLVNLVLGAIRSSSRTDKLEIRPYFQ